VPTRSLRLHMPEGGYAVSSELEAGGDIVSYYPKLVGFFVLLQLIGWSCTLIESFGGLDNSLVLFVFGDMTFALDISMCQVMFYGTLHRGPVSDDRLKWVCRVAFVVDGFCYLARAFTSFRPRSVADFFALRNATALGAMPDIDVMLRSGMQAGVIYFVALAFFSNIVGVAFLSVSRLRVVEWMPRSALPAFSDLGTRVYLSLIGVQLLLVVAMVAYALGADPNDAEQVVRVTKTTDAAKNWSTAIGQVYAFYTLIFLTTGQTARGLLRCESGKNGRKWAIHKAAAIAITILWQVLCLLFFVLALVAGSTTDGFAFNDLAMGQLNLHNLTQFTVWFIVMHDFEFNTTHLRSVDRGETRRERIRRTTRMCDADAGQPPLTSLQSVTV